MPISTLDPTSPTSTGLAGLGDDEFRALKQAVLDSWGGIDGLVTAGTGNPAATAADMIGLFDAIAGLTSGVGTGFVGEIRLWYGTAEAVPAGWYICDGANGTPDLRDRFPIGADSTGGLPTNGGATTGGVEGSGTTGQGGDGNFSVTIPDHTITLSNLPAHNHTLFGSEPNTSSGGTPVQPGQVATNDGSGMSDNNKPYQISPVPTNPSGVEPTTGRSGNTGQASPTALNHSGAQVVLPGHTHDLTGALPPWHAVYFIMYTGA